MATIITDYWANQKAQDIAGRTLYWAVFSTTPSADGTGGVELTGTAGTTRQAITWDAVSGANVTTASSVEVTLSGGSWAAPTAEGLYDASTGGNLVLLETVTRSGVSDGESYRNNSITFDGNGA